MTLSAIFVYPIKSMAGIALNSSLLEERGLPLDRRWMLVDAKKGFLSQRTFPNMARFTLEIKSDHLLVQYESDHIEIPLNEAFYQEQTEATVWGDAVDSLIAARDINEWFSKRLNTECQLVLQGSSSVRLTSPKYPPVQEVSYADGYPYLLISEASLAQLNSKLEQNIPMDRFRPNLVIKGDAAHIEDQFQIYRIGNAKFKSIKPCARCKMITIDQKTSTLGKEPLRTLAGYRKMGNKVLFGQYLILQSDATSMIRIGDEVKACNRKSEVELSE